MTNDALRHTRIVPPEPSSQADEKDSHDNGWAARTRMSHGEIQGQHAYDHDHGRGEPHEHQKGSFRVQRGFPPDRLSHRVDSLPSSRVGPTLRVSGRRRATVGWSTMHARKARRLSAARGSWAGQRVSTHGTRLSD